MVLSQTFQPLSFLRGVIILIILFVFSINILAQDTTYYKVEPGYGNWVKTTKDKAEFYRPSPLKKEGDLFKVEDFYTNGNLQMSGFSSSEKRDIYEGLVTWFYSDGSKQQTVTYKEGKKNGITTYFYKDGTIKAEGIYENNKPMNGKFVQEAPFGSSASFGNQEIFEYKDNKIIGGATTYYNTTQIAIKASIDKENKKVDFIYFDRFGEKIGQYSYGTKSTLQEGVEISFYKKNNQAIGIMGTKAFQNNVPNGEVTAYNNKGELIAKGIYQAGEPLDGTFQSAFGILTYKEGALDGPAVFYHPQKEFHEIAKGFYKAGLPWNGVFPMLDWGTSEFHTYKNGKQDGKQTTFFDNGSLENISAYYYMVDGKKEGESVKFKKSGEIFSEGIYKDDQPWSGQFHEKDGWNSIISTYADGMLNGPVTIYNRNNKFSEEKEYKNGKLTGWESFINPYTGEKDRVLYKLGGVYNREIIEGTYITYNGIENYKSGHVIEKIEYNEYSKKRILIKKFSIKTNLDQHDYNPTEIVERTFFDNDIAYTLTYQNEIPFDGIFLDYDEKITYKKGKKEGAYIHFGDNDNTPMMANYVNDRIEGKVTFIDPEISDTTYCIYRDSFPYEGIYKRNGISIPYRNGKKNGLSVVPFNYSGDQDYIPSIKTTTGFFKDDLLEGAVISYDENGNKIEEAIYKNDQFYEGNFYDIYEEERRTYSQGKLVRRVFNNKQFIFDLQYDIDKLLPSDFDPGDKKILQGLYKNDQPFEGVFYEDEPEGIFPFHETVGFILTSYKAGKKDGPKQYFDSYKKNVLKTENYKDGLLIGATEFSYQFRGDSEFSISYQAGLPHSGTLVRDQDRLLIIANFENGKQFGYEYYVENREDGMAIDSLFFKNGKPTHGAQLEYLYSKFHKHLYENGQIIESRAYNYLSHHRVQSIDPRTGRPNGRTISAVTNDVPAAKIKYSQNGFEMKFTDQANHIADHAVLTIEDKTKKSGTIKYSKSNVPIGYFKFSNGQITDFKFEEIYRRLEKDEEGRICRKDTFNNLSYIFYPEYELSNPPSYKDFYDGRKLLSRDGTAYGFMKGTDEPICSFKLKEEEIYHGTFVEPDSNDTFDLNVYENGKRILEEDNLSLEVLKKRLKELKKEKEPAKN